MKLPHKSRINHNPINLKGYKGLIITTCHSILDTNDTKTGETVKTGKATGVYASEMTEPYYTFLDAQMEVDVASILGGETPKHPETELRNGRAIYKSSSGLIDMFSNPVEVDKEHLIVTGQKQKAGIEEAQEALLLFQEKIYKY